MEYQDRITIEPGKHGPAGSRHHIHQNFSACPAIAADQVRKLAAAPPA